MSHQDPSCTALQGANRRQGSCTHRPPPAEGSVHSVSPGGRSLLRRAEDKCGPACFQEYPGPPGDPSWRPPAGCLGLLFCISPEDKGVNKWDIQLALWVYDQSQHVRAGRGFGPQLAQAPPSQMRSGGWKGLGLLRSHSLSVTVWASAPLPPSCSRLFVQRKGTVLNGYNPV